MADKSVKKRRFVFQCLFVFCLDCTRFYLLPYETCTILIIGSFEVSICYGKGLSGKFNVF